MANKFTIKIESILGGHGPTSHFMASDQFKASLGIDPALPLSDNGDKYGSIASGLLRPMGVTLSGTTVGQPNWMIMNPKLTTTYIYDSNGSVYSYGTTEVVTGLGDLNDGGTAGGNGAAYYDNYIYFARDTTVARYGPLDGVPVFTDDYWVATLGKTALTNNSGLAGSTPYPAPYLNGSYYPNHILHRHSDGKLYIADTIGNKGAIHTIQTTKTTVEGDTDAGSTYSKLQVGYGLYPTAMESYGSNLAIAFIEVNLNVSTNNVNGMRAKVAFWDTTSQNVNQITWVEFPDAIITGMKNINGVLYVVSGPHAAPGYRITKFVGGYTFEEVYYSEIGLPPYPGAIDGSANRLIFGSATNVPEDAACVWSFGLQKANLGQGIFNTIRTNATGSNPIVTALLLRDNFGQEGGYQYNVPDIGSYPSSGTAAGVIDSFNFNYDTTPQVWWSQMFRIGQPFKITKIRIPLAQAMAANMIITPTIYVDEGVGSYVGGVKNGVPIINNANFNGKRNIVFKPENLTGDHNFWLELRWTGSALCVAGLPITIEYELIDD